MSEALSVGICNALINARDDLGLISDIHTSYSGRGMYGRNCVGFDCDGLNEFTTINNYIMFDCDLSDEDINSYRGMIENTCVDNLGMSMIYYFPYFTWNDEVQEY